MNTTALDRKVYHFREFCSNLKNVNKKGGGSGGSIREAGGVFGEREAAIENAYFRKVEAEQLAALKKRHDEEIKHHEAEIQRHLVNVY